MLIRVHFARFLPDESKPQFDIQHVIATMRDDGGGVAQLAMLFGNARYAMRTGIQMAGYSSTPLAKKLGIKEGFRLKVENAPDHYLELLSPIPEGVTISSRLKNCVNIWHMFTYTKSGLAGKLGKAMQGIPDNGMIWVSWPKRASGVKTDMTEDEIRKAAFPLGLVDVKVCAVDETWSGLKLVIRKCNRK